MAEQERLGATKYCLKKKQKNPRLRKDSKDWVYFIIPPRMMD
jgi:hypothetical protein